MKRHVLAVALICLGGCKKPAAVGAVEADAGPATEEGKAGGWNEDKVKAFLAFERGLLASLQAPTLADGGRGLSPHLSEEQYAAAEGYERKKSGLSDDEIVTLNLLSSTLMTRKVMQKLAELGSMRGALLHAREDLPDGSVPEVDEALVVMAERQKRQEAYTEEREHFGNALIDAALPHEAELVSNWAAIANGGHGAGVAPDERK